MRVLDLRSRLTERHFFGNRAEEVSQKRNVAAGRGGWSLPRTRPNEADPFTAPDVGEQEEAAGGRLRCSWFKAPWRE